MHPLDDTLSVSSQIALDDVPLLAAQGITTLVSNRPDGEEPSQLTAADIGAAAHANGLVFVHIPVVPAAVDDAAVRQFSDARRASHGPVHAFCRTGTRAATLWALANTGALTIGERLAITAAAGYDLAALRPRLEASARAVTAGTSLAHDATIGT